MHYLQKVHSMSRCDQPHNLSVDRFPASSLQYPVQSQYIHLMHSSTPGTYPVSVSYTHLDVYKRQEQSFMQGMDWHLGSGLSIVLMIFVIASMAFMNRQDKENEGGDVYKRQSVIFLSVSLESFFSVFLLSFFVSLFFSVLLSTVSVFLLSSVFFSS